jgi:hypothetical protein
MEDKVCIRCKNKRKIVCKKMCNSCYTMSINKKNPDKHNIVMSRHYLKKLNKKDRNKLIDEFI